MIDHNDVIKKTNTILEGVARLREQWDRSRETIDSADEMSNVANAYIRALEDANQSLSDCVNGLIDEVDRIQAVNEEILRTAEAIAKIGKDLG